jgi:hypothetical protein
MAFCNVHTANLDASEAIIYWKQGKREVNGDSLDLWGFDGMTKDVWCRRNVYNES